MTADEERDELRTKIQALREKYRQLFDQLETHVYATDAELALLRAVADAAGKHLAGRGTVQTKTPLHHALPAWYRHLSETAKAAPPP